MIEKPGRATSEVLAEILPAIVRAFPWPKSMRWGAASVRPDALRWVRPLRSILCTFGPETRGAEIVPFAVDGVASGDVTYGHRFMAPEPIAVRRFDDYAEALQKAKVVLDADRRQGDHPRTTPRPRLRARARSWSRTRGCSTRSRAWSNGRSC